MDEMEVPHQYRFGMVADGQDAFVENTLRAHNRLNRSVLHIGSGGSYIVNKSVSDLSTRVFCGDMSPKAMSNLSRHNFPNVSPLVMDLFAMPFEDESFDLILSIGVYPIYRLRTADAPRALSEFHRVNFKRGELLVCNRLDGDNYSIGAFKRIAERVGYSVVGENIANDTLGLTDAKQRYVLLLQK